MGRDPLQLRIFLSSPGDVGEERAVAIRVLTELARRPLLEGKLAVQLSAWDDPLAPVPLSAHTTPQQSVIRYKTRPSECDLTIVVLWSRLGTVLPPGIVKPEDGSPYGSGTEWELDDARRAGKEVFVYRRTKRPRPATPEDEAQVRALEAFLDRELKNADGSLRGGLNHYADCQDFERVLAAHLEAFVGLRLDGRTKLPRWVLAAALGLAATGAGLLAMSRTTGAGTAGLALDARSGGEPAEVAIAIRTMPLAGTVSDERGAPVDGSEVSLVGRSGPRTSSKSGASGDFELLVDAGGEEEVELIVYRAGYLRLRQFATLGNRKLDVTLTRP